MVELYKHQAASVDAMLEYWAEGGGHGLIVIPTGGGKSLVAAELIRRLYQEHDARVLLASHVAKLISQNAAALARIWPSAPFGIYHAGLGKRDAKAPIVFAGIHSIFKRPEILGERHVLLIDEAHLLSHKDAGMYRMLIRKMQEAVPQMRVGGLTATPYRMSTGLLTENYGDHKALFSDVVFEVSILELIKEGYLCPVLPYVSPERLDVSSVGTSAGDYNQKQLQAAVDKEDINTRVVKEIIRAGEHRGTWLTFASGVDHAQHLCELFRQQGIGAEYIVGDTDETEREKHFKAMQSGELRCLVGVNTLTTGVDIPNIDLIACVRPTQSKGLWTQMIGRGTRLSPDTGKQNCILLDFTNNSLTHGPLDMLDGGKTAKAQGAVPVRACPECNFVHHISAKHCPQCQHEYPEGELKLHATSVAGPTLSTQDAPIYYNVDSIHARRHQKLGASDSLRIDYICGLRTVSQWVALEHPTSGGYARRWWEKNSTSGVAPHTVTEALQQINDLRVPGRICVAKDGKYDRIVAHDYSVPAGKVIPVETETARPPVLKRYVPYL